MKRKEGIYNFTLFHPWFDPTMPADTMEKQTASPIAGAPANGSHTPDKPKNASEHRKVRISILHFHITKKKRKKKRKTSWAS